MQTTELPEKNDIIHGRRLTDLESMDIALQDPPDISEIEDWIVQNTNMTRERLE